jgi:hypothetical protein
MFSLKMYHLATLPMSTPANFFLILLRKKNSFVGSLGCVKGPAAAQQPLLINHFKNFELIFRVEKRGQGHRRRPALKINKF